MILAGDIGGTKTQLGLFDSVPARPRPIVIRTFGTLDYPDLPSMIDCSRRNRSRHDRIVEIDAIRARSGVRGAMDVDQPPPRDDVLDVATTVAGGEVSQQRDFAFGARGEVGVPTLRRRGDEAAVDVVEECLAKTGSGGDQRDVAATQRFAFLQHVHFRRLQDRNRVRHRLQIVEEPDAGHAESRHHLPRVDLPWHVRQLRRLADDGAGDTEARGRNRLASRVVSLHDGGDTR